MSVGGAGAISCSRKAHSGNYADIPLIDMLFGTFKMQHGPPPKVGFWDGASREIGHYMMGKDVAGQVKGDTESQL